jgi:hypothetical protein
VFESEEPNVCAGERLVGKRRGEEREHAIFRRI